MRGKSTLSRSTQAAKKTRLRRLAESPEEREKRLEATRNKIRQLRASQTAEQRAASLKENRIRRAHERNVKYGRLKREHLKLQLDRVIREREQKESNPKQRQSKLAQVKKKLNKQKEIQEIQENHEAVDDTIIFIKPEITMVVSSVDEPLLDEANTADFDNYNFLH